MKVFRSTGLVCLLVLFSIGLFAQESNTTLVPQEQERASLPEAITPGTPILTQLPSTLGTAPELSVFRLMNLSGMLRDASGEPRSGVAGITFAIYETEQDGAPLWLETQNVQLDDNGRYSVLLGATGSNGLPVELFASGQARWLGIQVGLEPETARVPLVSVPYALKAAEAERLGGRTASEYLLAEQLQDEIRQEIQTLVQNSAEDGTIETATRSGLRAAQGRPTTDPAPPPQASVQPQHSDLEDLLNEINLKLDNLLAPVVFSHEVCIEPAAELEIAAKNGVDLIAMIRARLGALVYGNGAAGEAKVRPKSSVVSDLKGKAALKYTACIDLRALRQRLLQSRALSGLTLTQATVVDDLLNIDEAQLQAQILGAIDKVGITPTRIFDTIDKLSSLSGDIDPMTLLQAKNILTDLAASVPLPDSLRTRLQDTSQFITAFQSQRNFCSNPNIPPALQNLIGEICSLAQNERFAKLLDRVDKTTGTINSTATAIKNKVDNILGQLPTEKDCKFFC